MLCGAVRYGAVLITVIRSVMFCYDAVGTVHMRSMWRIVL